MKVLSSDGDRALTIANVIVDALLDSDVSPEDAIPALIAAIGMQAMETDDPGRALDEAAELLEEVTF